MLENKENFKEYKLGDICRMQNGFPFLSKKYTPTGKPIIRAGNVKDSKIDYSSLVYFDESDYKQNLDKYLFHPGDIAITKFGSCGKVIFNQTDKSFYLTNNFLLLEPDPKLLNKKYLFHLLLNKECEIQAISSEGMVPRLNTAPFREMKISIPNLETQKEVVQKLDKFLELNRELNRELKLRRQQHDYHRSSIIRSLHEKSR